MGGFQRRGAKGGRHMQGTHAVTGPKPGSSRLAGDSYASSKDGVAAMRLYGVPRRGSMFHFMPRGGSICTEGPVSSCRRSYQVKPIVVWRNVPVMNALSSVWKPFRGTIASPV